MWGRVLRWNYPILWFPEPGRRVNDSLNGSLPLLLSWRYGWRWDSHCCPVSKCNGTMRTSKFRAYLSGLQRNLSVFSCAMGCVETPGLFNAFYGSALGRRDKGRNSECACGRRCGLGQTSIFNLSTVETKHS